MHWSEITMCNTCISCIHTLLHQQTSMGVKTLPLCVALIPHALTLLGVMSVLVMMATVEMN